MEVMEIILILMGVIVFILSFLIPAGRGGSEGRSAELGERAVREMVDREVEGVRAQINGIVDETVSYALEKTERSMDRLTNEKMMAVNEYSDTVLEEINKNHKEVVFLYDMLNDKEQSLKAVVSEAARTAGRVQQQTEEVKTVVQTVQKKVQEPQDIVGESTQVSEKEKVFVPFAPVKVEAAREPSDREKEGGQVPEKRILGQNTPEIEVSLNPAESINERNSNEKILELHRAGKSNMAIARELGVGVGEVKLVIDLFEGM